MPRLLLRAYKRCFKEPIVRVFFKTFFNNGFLYSLIRHLNTSFSFTQNVFTVRLTPIRLIILTERALWFDHMLLVWGVDVSFKEIVLVLERDAILEVPYRGLCLFELSHDYDVCI